MSTLRSAAMFINLVLLLASFSSQSLARKEPQVEERCFKNLKPQSRPEVIFQSDAGLLEVWGGKSFEAMKDANVVAGRFTIKPGGLVMPEKWSRFLYIGSCLLLLPGSVSAGVLDESTNGNVYKLKVGDVVALPQGTPSWWFNDGDKDAIVLCVADTTTSVEPGLLMPFALAGAKAQKNGSSFGGAIQAFSIKFLAQAWGMSEDEAKKVVTSQQDTSLIKVAKGLKLPDMPAATDSNNATSFVYHYADAVPDLKVDGAGEVRELSSAKFPILRTMRMGAECVRMSQGALVAPFYSQNAHQLVYVHTGSGRVQIASSSGDRALDIEVQPGSLFVIPKFFPATFVASKDGLAFVSIVTSDKPKVSFLGGSGSLFSGIPSSVLSALLNIEDQLATKLQSNSKYMALIPPKKLAKQQQQP